MVLSPKEFTEVLLSHHVRTMASSPPEQPVIKYFMYAQHVRYDIKIICHGCSLIIAIIDAIDFQSPFLFGGSNCVHD